MVMSLRKFLSDIAASPWKLLTRLAQSSKVVSCVTPAVSVIASYLVLPGSLCVVLGSPASRHSTISVVFFRALHLLRPATYWLLILTLNLKFRYGSKRCGLAVNLAISDTPHLWPGASSGGRLVDLLAELEHDELGRLERREADQDVDDAGVDVSLRRRLAVTLDEERLGGGATLEGPGAELEHHEGRDVEPQRGPQRLVVRLEDGPLDAVVDALLQVDGGAADGDVTPLRVGARGEGARAPGDDARRGEVADDVDADGVEEVLLHVGRVGGEPDGAAEVGLGAGRRLPDPAPRVDARVEAGDEARRRRQHRQRGGAGRVAHLDPRVVDRAVGGLGLQPGDERLRLGDGVVGGAHVPDAEAVDALRAVVDGGADHVEVVDARDGEDAEVAYHVEGGQAVLVILRDGGQAVVAHHRADDVAAGERVAEVVLGRVLGAGRAQHGPAADLAPEVGRAELEGRRHVVRGGVGDADGRVGAGRAAPQEERRVGRVVVAGLVGGGEVLEGQQICGTLRRQRADRRRDG